MSLIFLKILHVVSAMLLVGVTFWAFASPRPETKRSVMKWSGIASLGVAIGGFGMHGMLHMGFPGWIIIKILCWLGLSAMGGIAFRHPEKIPAYIKIVILLVLLAVSAVYLKPF